MSLKRINGQNFKDQLDGLGEGISQEDIEAATTHRNNVQNPHSVTKAQVGLGNVNNTSDSDKPISDSTQLALSNKIDKDGTKVLSDYNFDSALKDKLDLYSPTMDKDASQIKLVVYTEPVTTDAIHSGDNVSIAIGKLERKIDIANSTSGDTNVNSDWNEIDINNASYILNKPTTITAQQSQAIIDLASASHSHTNSSILDLLGVIGGKLHYDGTAVNDTVDTVIIDGFGSDSIVNASSANNARLLKIDLNNLSQDVTALMSHRDLVSNPHSVTKSQVGLSNVNNTSDLDKPISTSTSNALNDKVDKDGSKVLSENNFTNELLTKVNALSDGTGESIILTGYDKALNNGELTATDSVNTAFGRVENRLVGLEDNSDHHTLINNPHSVTKEQVGLGNVDNTSDLNKPVSTATATKLDLKIDKDGEKVLSDNNFSDIYQARLNSVSNGATANSSDIQLRDRATHTGIQGISTIENLQSSLDGKEAGLGNPTTNNMILSSSVDGTRLWVEKDEGGTNLSVTRTGTDATIESSTGSNVLLEQVSITHAGLMTKDDKLKLNTIEQDSTSNNTNEFLLNRDNHTGSQEISTITGLQVSLDDKETNFGNPSTNGMILSSSISGSRSWVNQSDGVTNLSKTIDGNNVTIESSSGNSVIINSATTIASGVMTATDKVKLDAVNENATVNALDSFLLNRTNHTGVQNISTISNLQLSLDSKEDSLGNPDVSGKILSSSSTGSRTWIDVGGLSPDGMMTMDNYDTTSTGNKVDTAINAEKVNNKTVLENVPSGAIFTDTIYVHPSSSGNKHVPTGGATGNVLTWSEDGTAVWGAVQGGGVGDMTKSIYDVNNSGVVDNAEMVNNHSVDSSVPLGAVFTDTVYTHPSTTGNKHIPSGGSVGDILVWSGDGTVSWGASGSGDMSKAVYDTNNSGTVDNSDKVNNLTVETAVPQNAIFTDTVYSHPLTVGNKHIPAGGATNKVLVWDSDGTAVWGDVAGSGDMLKSTYDTNNSGIIDNSEKVNNLTVLTAVPNGAVFTDTVYTHPVSTGSKHVPSGGQSGNILTWDSDGVAVWANITGTGDMMKSTYDTNDSGVVDNSEKVNSLTVETAVPSGAIFTDTVYTHPITTGNKHIPSGGASGDTLTWSADGIAVWTSGVGTGDMSKATYDSNNNGVVDNSEKVNNLTIETAVPVGAIFTDTLYTHPISSGNKHVPSGGASGNILSWSSDGVAEWSSPTGTGDMLKATYDTNGSGIVDDAERVNNKTVLENVPLGAIFTDTIYTHPSLNHIPVGGASGNVLTWSANGVAVWSNPSGTGDMSKAIYDTNDNGIVDNAEKVNSLTVETAVPANAIFTDTTYSVGDMGLTQVNFTNVLKADYDSKEDGLSNPATDGQILSSSTAGVRSWINAPSGTTDLSFVANENDVLINSSTGIGIAIASATITKAGILTKNDKIKLDGVAVGSTANDTDSNLLNRTNHTGTQATSTIIGLDNALLAKEASLGNPDVDGKVLSSLADGTRSWIVSGSSGSSNGSGVTLDTTNFDKVLSSTDTNVQTAFETIDEKIGDVDTALSSILGREI